MLHILSAFRLREDSDIYEVEGSYRDVRRCEMSYQYQRWSCRYRIILSVKRVLIAPESS
jgi:hypothetical protein